MVQSCKEGVPIELSSRQLKIIQIVKDHAPIIGERIAEMLGLSRPTIRSDLSVLVMAGYLNAKPKVGYTLGNTVTGTDATIRKCLEQKVKNVQSLPTSILETTSVNDAVITLFVEDVGSLFVTDPQGFLTGIISRKDLLKVTLGNQDAPAMPVSLVMTRVPNVITVSPEDSVLEAARKMIHHQVYSLPVVKQTHNEGQNRYEAIGRVTKTTMAKVLIRLAVGSFESSSRVGGKDIDQ